MLSYYNFATYIKSSKMANNILDQKFLLLAKLLSHFNFYKKNKKKKHVYKTGLTSY